jgi:Rps23 Pro-64 3,4-dihydroxylase Tpa1-like proline 4-hydroxylase
MNACIDRLAFADRIIAQLASRKQQLHEEFVSAGRGIRYFVLDELLDPAHARQIYENFPKTERMVLKKSLREDKYIGVQMNRYDKILEEVVYAFQDPRVVQHLTDITEISELSPDANLYAGGLSAMTKGQFLNPHLDNSHDKDRRLYRVLNLLYYVTPDWREECGGNLELWEHGLKGQQTTVWSKFNRLVCMITHRQSWHSVSPIQCNGMRCCVSNYYFSPASIDQYEYFHVTSFRGRPGQKLRNLILVGDAKLRALIRKVFKVGIRPNPHVYKRGGQAE